jgi:hypothetical protein
MPLLANIINPYLWGSVIEDPNPKRNRVYINNLAFDKDTLEPIATPEDGIPNFFFRPASTTDETISVSAGPNWYDWPIILTTGKYGNAYSDSRQNWPSRIGSWDPWLLFLDYNAIQSRNFYNQLTDYTYIFYPRDMTTTNMRQDIWIGQNLEGSAAYRTTTDNNYLVPAILRDDNQWIALDQNYYGTTIVWASFNSAVPGITQITYNDRLQHFVLGNDDLGRSWFLEVHGGTHAYTVQVVGMNTLANNVQITSSLIAPVTGGYSNVINQFPSNFIPNNSKRKVFYSSHYNTSASLAPRRFVWDQAKGTIEYSLCNLTYTNVGDTFGTYGQVCSDSTTNYSDYGTNSWFIKPHVFVKNDKYYITFCNVEKSQPFFRSERWLANEKQRTWLTYEIDNADDNNLIFHSVISWATVDDMPRMFLPMNSDGDKLLVFQTNRVTELLFTPNQGWTTKKITSLDARGYGIDSTGRIYLATRSGAQPSATGGGADGQVHNGYNNIYTYESSVPDNIELLFDSASYNYTGTPINTNLVVNTNNRLPTRLFNDAGISALSPFGANTSYSLRTSWAVATAGRLSAPNYIGFDFGTGDFCVEFWMFNNVAFSTQSNLCGIIGHKTGDAYFGWQIFRNGDSKLCLRLSTGTAGGATNTFDFKTVSDVPGDNSWHHWALVRQSGGLKWYLDGVLDSSVPSTHNIFDHHAYFSIGYSQTSGAYYSGWLSNVRVVKGNCVYTDNFIVPTSPLTAVQSSGTNINAITPEQCTILTCSQPDMGDYGNVTNTGLNIRINSGEVTFADGSTTKQIITTNGTASIPIVINGNNYSSIDCYNIIPLTWATPAGILTNAAKGESYSFKIDVEGSDGATYTLSSGELPPGLTLNYNTGYITGIPANTQPTVYSFSITVANSTESIVRNFQIYVTLERPSITSLVYPQAENNILVANILGGETIGIIGTNFRSGAVVRIDGIPVTTTYISDTYLTFETVPLSSGTHYLTVYNTDNVLSSIFNIPFSSVPAFITPSDLTPILENLPAELLIQYSSDSNVTWTVISSNLPGTLQFNSATQKITGNPGMISTDTATYNITLQITDGENQTIQRTYNLVVYKVGNAGQVSWTTPGTYTWICPYGPIEEVSIVAIGGGGSGSANGGGGGGGLGWKNNIPVVAGQSYTIVVGAGGTAGNNGGNSYFEDIQLVAGYGGIGAKSTGIGGAYTGDGGGNGGNGGLGAAAGGGGAGGYTGSGGYGGAGNYVSNTLTQSGGNATGGGGGGGGGSYNQYGNGNYVYAGGGGGGVGLQGEGTSGSGAVQVFVSNFGSPGYGGTGGSGGQNGGTGSTNVLWNSQNPGGIGGNYGGGGGGPKTNTTVSDAAGGAVRLIWGPNRSWPNTNTADV